MPIQAPPGFQYDAQGRLMPVTPIEGLDRAPHPWLRNARVTHERTEAARAGGLDVPDDYRVSPHGNVVKSGGFSPLMLAPLAPLAGMFLPAAFGAGGAAGATAPAATGAAAGGSAATAGAAAAGGLSGVLKSLFTDPNNLMGLAGVVAALAGGRGGSSDSMQNAERLNQITEQRMRRVDPLHQAITQLAWNRLPINSRQGITAPTYEPLR